jgi:serine/threonine-protein kinase
LDSFEETTLVSNGEAQAPFFSPDGHWLGFAADGYLKKVPVAGGEIAVLCQVEVMHGATWNSDGTIVFSGAEGLLKISATGGEPVLLTEEELELRGEVGHHNPQFLPGGEAVIFVTVRAAGDPLEIALFDRTNRERKTLLEGGGNARFLPTAHLAYAAEGKLFVVGFDPDEHELLGTPVPVVTDLMMGFAQEPSLAHFAVSDNGILAYLSGPTLARGSRWVWVDRTGTPLRTGEFQKRMSGPKLSPDGTRIAVAAERWQQSGIQVWIEDLTRGTFSRLTFERESWWPLWSPDGQGIAFSSLDAEGGVNLFWRSADGSGTSHRLTRGEFWRQSAAWTRDGRTLIFHQSRNPETGWDILALSFDGDVEPRPLLSSRFDELQPALSPDDRWLAYVSNETGRSEVYVRHYPDLAAKWQISNQGGTEPAWSSQGDELFYRDGLKCPQMLFESEFVADVQYGRGFDVAPDDQGFVFMEQSSVANADYELRIVLDWFEELNRLVPVDSG